MWKLFNLQLYRYIKNNPIWTDRQVWSSEKRRKPKFMYYVNFLKPVKLKWYLIASFLMKSMYVNSCLGSKKNINS